MTNTLADDLREGITPDHVVLYSSDFLSMEALEQHKREIRAKRPIVVLVVDSDGRTTWKNTGGPDD